MGLMDNISKLITEHGTILKERLELFRDQMEHLVKENERLQKENETVKKENQALNEKLESQTAADEFVKHRGVLFLRLPNGDIQDEVYCPECHGPMMSLDGDFPFMCKPCDFRSGFKGGDLPRVIAEIS